MPDIISTSNHIDGLRFTLVSCENIVLYLNGFPANSTTPNLKRKGLCVMISILIIFIKLNNYGSNRRFTTRISISFIHRYDTQEMDAVLCNLQYGAHGSTCNNICTQTFHILFSSLYTLRLLVGCDSVQPGREVQKFWRSLSTILHGITSQNALS